MQITEHCFFHADREGTLQEGQMVVLNNMDLSRFGHAYWDAIVETPFEDLSPAAKREALLEEVKKDPSFHFYSSRLQSMFGANTIEDAIWFARSITPVPLKPIRIFEVFATKFWTLDMNWLDFASDPIQTIQNYREYWGGKISNSVRRPPRLEVLIPLPARIGKVVYTVNDIGFAQ
ncbi:hypothetical protein [Herbaspirillum sp. NPDC101396]|uniref:hypothetical protein n=1 Tax=Herbaspirillum sp. NPDC101396 TaxID=3364005 RepID=UPI00383B0E85